MGLELVAQYTYLKRDEIRGYATPCPIMPIPSYLQNSMNRGGMYKDRKILNGGGLENGELGLELKCLLLIFYAYNRKIRMSFFKILTYSPINFICIYHFYSSQPVIRPLLRILNYCFSNQNPSFCF